ncbi:MAG: DUF1127 domain-containing protein [Ruegeria sp.]
MANVSTLTHGGLNLSARFREFVARIKQANARATEYSQTYSELQRLSDRELNDIGIRRCDIADIAREHAYCS